MCCEPVQAQLFKKILKHQEKDSIEGLSRLIDVMDIVEENYVDNPRMDHLSDEAIRAVLRHLDPHCLYIPADQVERANESLNGSFVGIGITFNIIRDSVVVVDLLPDGTAKKAGLLRGDRIVAVGEHSLLGDSLNNSLVSKYVRGPKGEDALFHIVRQGTPLTITIGRQSTRIASVKPYFMVNDTIGYICIERFSRNTVAEFVTTVNKLKSQGMNSMILDLRGNTGGYLDVAIGIANELLDKGSLIVYTEGRKQKRQEARATRNGCFRRGQMVVLLDERSASASEVLSGALQDWDRATIVGRRSFGKGLVQRIFTLSDGGQVRVTTARYYTPSGRCIQKPYGDTINYSDELNQRYKRGELFSSDSIRRSDSLRYYTQSGRVVYGGGGIIPDVFVPLDTTHLSDLLRESQKKNLIRTFAQDWADSHRQNIEARSYDVFLSSYDSMHVDDLFLQYAISELSFNEGEFQDETYFLTPYEKRYLNTVVKGYIAERLFGVDYYYLVTKEIDPVFQSAITTLRISPVSMRTK